LAITVRNMLRNPDNVSDPMINLPVLKVAEKLIQKHP